MRIILILYSKIIIPNLCYTPPPPHMCLHMPCYVDIHPQTGQAIHCTVRTHHLSWRHKVTQFRLTITDGSTQVGSLDTNTYIVQARYILIVCLTMQHKYSPMAL